MESMLGCSETTSSGDDRKAKSEYLAHNVFEKRGA